MRQPILTQYCDGHRVQCRNRGWMTQWGSKSLGDQGYSPIEILRYFYGNDMYINVAEEISGIPSSWPGYDLNIGATGEKVLQIQEQLNVIAGAYPAIPKVNADGIYGEQTSASVRKFQNVFGLPETGITDYQTWYKIQEIYVAVSQNCGIELKIQKNKKIYKKVLTLCHISGILSLVARKQSCETEYAEVSELADEQD